jgi:hypothetical protein
MEKVERSTDSRDTERRAERRSSLGVDPDQLGQCGPAAEAESSAAEAPDAKAAEIANAALAADESQPVD